MQSPWQTFEGMSGSEAGLLLFVTCMDAMLDEEQFWERNPMREADVSKSQVDAGKGWRKQRPHGLRQQRSGCCLTPSCLRIS